MSMAKERFADFRLMAEAEGYVLFRRKGCYPSVMSRTDWDKLRKDYAKFEASNEQ